MPEQRPMVTRTSARRRVAIFLNDMNSAGGVQRVAANLACDLRSRYETTLLTVEPIRDPVFYRADLEFCSLGYRRNPRSRLHLLKELVIAGCLLRRFVVTKQIDTVLAFWYDWASVAAFSLPRSVKRVACEHMAYSEPTSTWKWIRSRSYRHLDAVVGLTSEDLPHLQRIAKRAQVIPNYCYQAEPVSTGGREKILLTVGHLHGRKGLDRLLWGLKQPLIDNPDWKLVVIGGGEKGHADWGYLDYICTLIQLFQLQGRVEFYPATDRISDWYRRASIYVLGSRQEGLPMVLIEAKAHGLPIIAFDCPTGPKEIVRTGVDGFLVQNDSNEFAECAGILMSNPGRRCEMGEAAIDDFKMRFSREVIIPQWFDLIDSLHGAQNFAGFRAEYQAGVGNET